MYCILAVEKAYARAFGLRREPTAAMLMVAVEVIRDKGSHGIVVVKEKAGGVIQQDVKESFKFVGDSGREPGMFETVQRQKLPCRLCVLQIRQYLPQR